MKTCCASTSISFSVNVRRIHPCTLEIKPINLQLNESARIHTKRGKKEVKRKRNTIGSLLLSWKSSHWNFRQVHLIYICKFFHLTGNLNIAGPKVFSESLEYKMWDHCCNNNDKQQKPKQASPHYMKNCPGIINGNSYHAIHRSYSSNHKATY